MSNVQTTKKSPQIRFKNFSEDWTQKKYTETFDTSVSNNTLSRVELTTERTSTQNVHYGDVLIKFDSILDVKNNEIPYIPEDVKIDSKNLLKNGDIVFADTAEDETCGKATELNNIDNEKLVAGLHTFVARPKLKFEPKYLGYFINSPAYHNQLLPFMQGTKVTSISKTSIQKTWVNYPDSTEQSKIGTIFSQIDSLIASTQKEHDKLVALKKCMLQKMFPKKGSLVPEIRFKGFSGDWEEKNITDLATIFIGLVTTMTKFYSNQGTLLIRNSDIKDNYFSFADKPIYLTQEFANQNSNKKHRIGDVITVHTGDVGTSAVITEKENGTIGFATIVTRPKDNLLDSMFLSIFLNSDKHKLWAVSVSTGDGRTNYNLGDYTQLQLLLPTLEEQQKIGSYFQNLDNLISKQAAELEKLKNVKKTLLSKMFV
ncbi:MAG: restriction endonuclease subunit S [Treponema sp.]|nr:restriction endonuclease subunit S [Treponema sp.]